MLFSQCLYKSRIKKSKPWQPICKWRFTLNDSELLAGQWLITQQIRVSSFYQLKLRYPSSGALRLVELIRANQMFLSVCLKGAAGFTAAGSINLKQTVLHLLQVKSKYKEFGDTWGWMIGGIDAFMWTDSASTNGFRKYMSHSFIPGRFAVQMVLKRINPRRNDGRVGKNVWKVDNLSPLWWRFGVIWQIWRQKKRTKWFSDLTCASVHLQQTTKFNIQKRKFIVRPFDFIPKRDIK